MAHPDPILMRNSILARLCETHSNPGWREMQDWLQITRGICPYIDNGTSDHLVITSITDTTAPGGLIEKIKAGTGISLTQVLDGGINKILITNTAPGTIDDHLVIASGGTGPDTPGSLITKIFAGTGISISTVLDGGITKVSITNTSPGTIDDHLVKSSVTDATAVGGLVEKTKAAGGTTLTEIVDTADGNKKKLQITSAEFSSDDPLPNGIADPGVNTGKYSGDKHIHPKDDTPYGDLFLRNLESVFDHGIRRKRQNTSAFLDVVVNSHSSLVDRVIFDGTTEIGFPSNDPGVAVWPAGIWKYRLWFKTDGVAPVRFLVKTYRYTPITYTEFEYDSYYTGWVDSTSLVLEERAIAKIESAQNTEDLVHIKIWAETASVSSVTAYISVGHVTNSYVNTPLSTQVGGAGGFDDHLVLSDNGDLTAPGGLDEKVKVVGLAKAVATEGGVDKLELTNEQKVKVRAEDPVAGYLGTKIGSPNSTITKINSVDGFGEYVGIDVVYGRAANTALQGNEVTATPTADKVPIADGSGKLTSWIAAATTTTQGIVELATDGENAANVVVQGNDSRLSNARTPSAHAATHKHGGSDEVATATPAANAIPKADGSGKLNSWVDLAGLGGVTSSGAAGYIPKFTGSNSIGNSHIGETAGTIIIDSSYNLTVTGDVSGANISATPGAYKIPIADGSGTLDAWVTSGGGGVPTSRTLTAGNGLTGGGDLTANRTFNVVAADSSITVNADSIQVGVISDSNHGNRSGGSLHSAVTTSVNGFMSAADKTKLDGVASGATALNLSSGTPTSVGYLTPSSGSGTTASRSDHRHAGVIELAYSPSSNIGNFSGPIIPTTESIIFHWPVVWNNMPSSLLVSIGYILSNGSSGVTNSITLRLRVGKTTWTGFLTDLGPTVATTISDAVAVNGLQYGRSIDQAFTKPTGGDNPNFNIIQLTGIATYSTCEVMGIYIKITGAV